jgi:hypothetical protein
VQGLAPVGLDVRLELRCGSEPVARELTRCRPGGFPSLDLVAIAAGLLRHGRIILFPCCQRVSAALRTSLGIPSRDPLLRAHPPQRLAAPPLRPCSGWLAKVDRSRPANLVGRVTPLETEPILQGRV